MSIFGRIIFDKLCITTSPVLGQKGKGIERLGSFTTEGASCSDPHVTKWSWQVPMLTIR